MYDPRRVPSAAFRAAASQGLCPVLVCAGGGNHGQPDADGGGGVANVRPHLQRLGSGAGGFVSVCAGLADDAAGRPGGRPLAPRPHFCGVYGAAGGGGAAALERHAGRLCFARTDLGGFSVAGGGARLSAAGAAGAGAAVGAGVFAVARLGAQRHRHGNCHHRRPGAGRASLHHRGCECVHLLHRVALAVHGADCSGALPTQALEPCGQLGEPVCGGALCDEAQADSGRELAGLVCRFARRRDRPAADLRARYFANRP